MHTTQASGRTGPCSIMLWFRSDAHHASANDHTCLIPQAAAIGGSFYLFGGMAEITDKTPIFTDMLTKYRLPITDTSEGCAVFHTSWRYDVSNNSWTALPSPPFPVVAGGTVVLQERYIVLLGSEQRTTFRVGNTSKGVLPTALGEPPASALSRCALTGGAGRRLLVGVRRPSAVLRHAHVEVEPDRRHALRPRHSPERHERAARTSTRLAASRRRTTYARLLPLRLCQKPDTKLPRRTVTQRMRSRSALSR